MSESDTLAKPPLPVRAREDWVISIRPQYSAQIFAGVKRVELRRRAPRWEPGQSVHVYESAPTMAVVGRIVVGRVVVASADEVWARYASSAGIGRPAFDAYLCGLGTCCAIEIVSAERIEPVALATLRDRGFTAPQSWARIDARLLGLMASLPEPDDGFGAVQNGMEALAHGR